jgi:signal transduction histidine kinase
LAGIAGHILGAASNRIHQARGPEEDVAGQVRIPLGKGIAGRIGQVATNYLSNALKYSAPDRPVAVSLQVGEGEATVRVRDEGPGLTPEQRAQVWERYQRVAGVAIQDSAQGTGGGLGLGLHISRSIVEQHGGSVGVESTPGRGSTFWFTLPVAPA